MGKDDTHTFVIRSMFTKIKIKMWKEGQDPKDIDSVWTLEKARKQILP